jgi:hypothetical protein
MHSRRTFMGNRVRYNEVQGPNKSWMREDSLGGGFFFSLKKKLS